MNQVQIYSTEVPEVQNIMWDWLVIGLHMIACVLQAPEWFK